MGSRKVKAPSVESATPVAAQAHAADAEQADMAMEDQVRRRRGISQMYNRFGMMAGEGGKSKLGV